MSSLRQDPLTGRWVIIAAERQGRPNEFRDRIARTPDRNRVSGDCPFCPGQEHQTPAEVFATGRSEHDAADSPTWRVRVFPNKFPAVQAEPGMPECADDPLLRPQGLAQGGHEVVVCGPGHHEGLGVFSVDHLTEILTVVRQRVETLGLQHSSARYVLAFANHGPEAGATLAHPHLQIIATPVVPALVVDKVENFARHRAAAGHCLLCDSLAAEQEAEIRLVADNSGWVAVAPWASRFACEMRLIPRRHSASLLDASGQELRELAQLMGLCLERLDDHSPGAGFNIVIHSEPLAAAGRTGYGNERLDQIIGNLPDAAEGLFHWHVEILPRLTRLAGFEAGTGFAINSLPPEDAAACLRPEGS